MTEWVDDVNLDNPLPEYPRPQFQRDQWLSLNGLWQIQKISSASNFWIPYTSDWSEILVPFPIESALSGIMDQYPWMWYRRTFSVPTQWENQRILLHFEAVDWQTEIWVDEQFIGIHQGGYDPFSIEITPQMLNKFDMNHTLLLRVYDPTNDGHQPIGKQSLDPAGTFYTSCSGIWQSVWLEPVSQISIDDIKLTPDIDAQQLDLMVFLSNGTPIPSNLELQAIIRTSSSVISNASFWIDFRSISVNLTVPNPVLWSGINPFLYNLTLRLLSDGYCIDTVESYFGMRKIGSALINGTMHIMLNNQPVYLCGPLDQGFWPDGVYTAPTDEALAWDIYTIKNYGFNMTRKHVKIESRRWYYHCDRLGLLVFQDMVSGWYGDKEGPGYYFRELQRLIDVHYNSPCIIEWTLFNEGWGQHNTVNLTKWAELYDPSRLISSASGWVDVGMSDIVDFHSYPNPICPPPQNPARIQICGEYGGIGYKIPNHTWTEDSWAYMWAANESDWIEKYTLLAQKVNILHHLWNLSAVVYTQITDVEQEMNGLVTYDRKVLKVPFAPIAAANRLWCDTKQFTAKEILAVSGYHKTNWSYTFSDPGSQSKWYETNYDASSWSIGSGGFGTWGTPGTYINTYWNTTEIWLRQSFTVNAEDLADLDQLFFFLHHDDGTEIYLNGVLAASVVGYVTSYAMINITSAAKNTLSSSQLNTIAVHCRQEWGGQYIDVGIIRWKES